MTVPSSLHDFVVAAIKEDLRIDGRRPFDSRRLSIKFAREDGTAEVQLGQTHVLCVVSSQLTQPFPDRPNEGSLFISTEFSPMADPSFEPGRPGESAVELGRVIDRGLRESRALDMESLCVVAGKAVWALRVDISVLDNGGNLIDAANIAVLAALLSFRRPECTTGSGGLNEIVIHPPEVKEPIPLILHHLPISTTFAFFGDGEFVVMDPSDKEELVMKGRLTVTMNVHGDICSVQKGGGVGVRSSEIMRCFRIASTKVADITTSLKKAIEVHEIERAQRKIKRHKNVYDTEGLPLEIGSGVKDDTEKSNVIPKDEKIDYEESSGDEETDSNVKSSSVCHNDASIFEGGVSKWVEDMQPANVDLSEKPQSGKAEGFLDQVSQSVREVGGDLNEGKASVKPKKKKRKQKLSASSSTKQ